MRDSEYICVCLLACLFLTRVSGIATGVIETILATNRLLRVSCNMNNWTAACVPSGHGAFQSLPTEDPPPWRGSHSLPMNSQPLVSEETNLPGVRTDPQPDGSGMMKKVR